MYIYNIRRLPSGLIVDCPIFQPSRTGILVFGPKGNSGVESVVTSLGTHGVAHEVLSGSEANSKYPQQLKLPEDFTCVFEEGGGILRASKAVFAFQVNALHDCQFVLVCGFFLCPY